MSFAQPIDRLSISGFKSLQNVEDLELRAINVLIGANGAGKSNFVSFFHMLTEMMAGRLQSWTRKQGSANRIVSFGIKETKRLSAHLFFGDHGYYFTLEPTIEGGFAFRMEIAEPSGYTAVNRGHIEAEIPKIYHRRPDVKDDIYCCYESISNWKTFHFHDTSDTAGVKRLGSLHDNDYLRPDASNLAAFLYRLKHEHEATYEQIRKTVSLAIPFFDDFVLKPQALPTEEEQIRLLWRQKDSDYPFWPSQLSDGSIRFICLATALLQPEPPSTIIIDEPELGLHPYAITLLGSLIRSASKRMQLIVSTQSVPLVNEFSIEDLIIVERENGASVFRRHDEKDFELWLEEYTVGELWEKNVLGGRPGPDGGAGQ
ncbi:recombinase RecF [Lujinxingia sediminis]|uniref:Recombinase RecF n=1 Tax=Lujinxingia sediminis TaxID=2480984 RepID=A0ABY0CV32_9DELT|nr:AAA family ATPase [Lujinxingia sediminis]RVU45766.1 recombinase RecF [Lujinxingia sediminis]